MYEYINGKITELTPTFVVIDNNGMGYHIHISLNTYTQLNGLNDAKVYLHQVIKEDAHLFYGFFDTFEREVFRYLISVSGVGANTGRMMLSTLSPIELGNAIANADIDTIKSVKGIGLKTAQRLVVELKDKIHKVNSDIPTQIIKQDLSIKSEAMSALEVLGFNKNNCEKTIQNILSKNKDISLEDLIKTALKLL